VQICFEAGLVRGKDLFFDATKVRANADVDSLCSRSLVENPLDGLSSRKKDTAPARAGGVPVPKVQGADNGHDASRVLP
jgi:hypothetical protein